MEYHFRQQEIGGMVTLWLYVGEGFELDEFALNMMNRNDLKHLVPVQLVQRDGASYLQYDINAMQSMYRKMSVKLMKADAMQILNSVTEAFEEVEDFMLTEDVLVLDIQYVYFDQNGQCKFLCVPCKQGNTDEQIDFLRKIVERMLLCYADTDTFVYDIANAFNRGAIRKLTDMKDVLRKLEGMKFTVGKTDEFTQKESFEIPVVPVANTNLYPQKEEIVQKEVISEKPSASSIGFQIPGKEEGAFSIPKQEKKKDREKGRTRKEVSQKPGIVRNLFKKSGAGEKKEPRIPIPQPENIGVNKVSDMYESYEKTVMVSDEAFAQESTRMIGSTGLSAVLTRKRTKEQFVIYEGESVIGSGSAAACIISGNKAISRLHAVLKLERDRVSLQDNHSSNGTWVDGRRLMDKETVFLGSHAVIRLANEEFDFTLNIQ